MIVQLIAQELEAYNRFLSHFTVINQGNDETICHCPVCGKDKLYITAGRNKSGNSQILMDCKHSCDYKDILQAAGLQPKALYLTEQRRISRDMCADKRQHIYTDRDGNPLFRKTIYKYHSFYEYNGKQKFPNDKDTFWEHYEPDRGYQKGGSCNVLYHLDKLSGDVAYIPEGEKDVETLESMGFIATTAGGGAKAKASEWQRHNYAAQLEGIKTAYILADNDEIGIKYAYAVGEYLTANGIECKVIQAAAIYENALKKWDISDIVGAVGAEKARELLEKAIDAAELYCPAPTTKGAAGANSSGGAGDSSQNPYNKDGSGRLTETNLRHALDVLGISIKYDAILHQTDISGKCLEPYLKESYSAILPVFLYDELQHHLKGVTVDKIGGYINNITFSKSSVCNPILEMINGEQWDNTDRLGELFEIMHIDESDELSRVLLRKWLMQCYCALHNELDNPFSVDEVLVLVGKQAFGKTRLLEHLSLKRLYFGEGMCYDPRNKDSQIQAVSKWIVELGEIGSTMKKDINAVKAFISLSVDEYRVPYGKTPVKYARKTCFCGSTNDMRFLIDETGNRRFFAVKLPDDKFIDVKSNRFKKFNFLQLWAQIKHIVDTEISNGETYASAFRLSREELEQLEARNVAHTKLLKGELEIVDILSKATTPENGYELGEGYFTPTQFKEEHSELNRYSSEQVGKVLKKLGYVVVRKRVPNTSSVATFYKLPYRKWLGNSALSAI